ncbi:hypothetical protein [Bdellovibrio sp.]|uniref:hypothetical protein n=1 Tax=Bdellovibrio sp. TaxID=28201 RepID=UPI0039E22823
MKFSGMFLGLLLVLGLVSCAHTEKKISEPRLPASTSHDSAQAAQDFLCMDAPTVPPRKENLVITVHLETPVEHAADVKFAGELQVPGVVQVHIQQQDGSHVLFSETKTTFSKEPVAYAGEMRASLPTPGKERGWISLVPKLKKSFGKLKYEGGYTGGIYISNYGLGYQTQSLTCRAK